MKMNFALLLEYLCYYEFTQEREEESPKRFKKGKNTRFNYKT